MRSPGCFAPMTVGQRLGWLLVVRGLTQAEASRLANVSQPAIANLIGSTTRQPSAKTLLHLAHALNTTPQFLLFGDGDPLVETTAHSSNEQQLLEQFRLLDSTKKSHVLAFIRILQD